MNRRQFLSGLVTTAAGLVLPYEPQRVYSFANNLRVPGGFVENIIYIDNQLRKVLIQIQNNHIQMKRLVG